MPAADAGLTVICPACGLHFTAPAWVEAAPVPTPVVSAAPSPRRASRVSPWLLGCGLLGVGLLLGATIVAAGLWWHLRPGRGNRRRPPTDEPIARVIPRPVAKRPTLPPLIAPTSLLPPPPPPATEPASRPATRPVLVAVATRPATVPVVTAPPRPPQPPAVTRPTGPIVAVRPPVPPPDLDQRIGRAIDRGVTFLLGKAPNGILPDASDGEGPTAGADALVVYALLQSAQAVDRPDLAVNQPRVARMLDALRRMPMEKTYTTYDRSLRAAALAVYNRAADRQAIRVDSLFLQQQARLGAYTYDPMEPLPAVVPKGQQNRNRREIGLAPPPWDNSNSQYGALGVWIASDAGVNTSTNYWQQVRNHWLACQLANGQWGYGGPESAPQLSMTVAGITTLLVAEDQLGQFTTTGPAGRSPFTPAVARGMKWLETGDNCVDLPGQWATYTMYGIERAALASGYKTFGTHDWYRELAERALALQQPDGSWIEGGDAVVDTSFTLLFLARGRHPILFDKLRFDGVWANHPRDAAHLARFATTTLERPFNWQVVSAAEPWPTWMDAPALYLASHLPLALPADQVDKLRSYAQAGGLIVTSSDGTSGAFDGSVAELAKQLFPQYRYAELPGDHPVYRSLYPLERSAEKSATRPATGGPALFGVSNGSRLLLVHSPTDLGKAWQARDPAGKSTGYQMGLNLFIYAAGRADFRNKLRSAYLPEPEVTPIAHVGLARVTYDGGDDDPEPAATGRFARAVLGQTSVAVDVSTVDAAKLDAARTPMALLTGTGPARATLVQLAGLRSYVADGGVLLVDACGGSEPAVVGTGDLLAAAFPGLPLADLPADHPILTGTGPALPPASTRLRPYAANRRGRKEQPLRFAAVGRGAVLFTSADLTTGLLGSGTWAVEGYTPDAATGLVRNALFWAANRR